MLIAKLVATRLWRVRVAPSTKFNGPHGRGYNFTTEELHFAEAPQLRCLELREPLPFDAQTEATAQWQQDA